MVEANNEFARKKKNSFDVKMCENNHERIRYDMTHMKGHYSEKMHLMNCVLSVNAVGL